MKSYWLAKTEPETFSWDDLVRDGKTIWDGVRNYAARNNLRLMKAGDLVFIYHSVSDKCIVGIARVSRESFQDPSDPTGTWSSVEMIPLCPFHQKISLAVLKEQDALQEMILLKNSRLSVQPVDESAFRFICTLGKVTLPSDAV